MLPNIGTWELIVILLVVFLVFGSKRLPEIASGLGKGIRAFRREVQGLTEDIQRPADAASTARTRPKSAQTDTPTPPPGPTADELSGAESAKPAVEEPPHDDGPVML